MARERGAAPVARIEGVGTPAGTSLGSPVAFAENGAATADTGKASVGSAPSFTAGTGKAVAAAAPAARIEARADAPTPAASIDARAAASTSAATTGGHSTASKPANGVASPGPSASGDATSSAAGPGVLERVCAWFAETFPNSRHAVLGGIAGLIVAIMLFTIGVLKTLVILVLVVVGVACGQYLDGDPKIIRMVQSLAKRR